MTTISPTVSALHEEVQRAGIAGVPGALPRAWGEVLAEDFAALFAEARGRPDGTVDRGTNRYYFAVHPERLRGLVELLTHPVLQNLSASMLGPAWRVIEVAFDVPLPGSRYQPWHRDFATPPETAEQRRLTSLAFNFTGADVTPDMGPFEIAPGTHWDDGTEFDHGMFPGESARYDALAVRKLPRLGDMAVRTGLTVHRGTPNRSSLPRPVLIVGVVGPEVATEPQGLEMSAAYLDAMDPALRDRLDAHAVDELRPLVQTHDIEGLMMGA